MNEGRLRADPCNNYMTVSRKLGGFSCWESLQQEPRYLGSLLGPLTVGNSQPGTPCRPCIQGIPVSIRWYLGYLEGLLAGALSPGFGAQSLSKEPEAYQNTRILPIMAFSVPLSWAIEPEGWLRGIYLGLKRLAIIGLCGLCMYHNGATAKMLKMSYRYGFGLQLGDFPKAPCIAHGKPLKAHAYTMQLHGAFGCQESSHRGCFFG